MYLKITTFTARAVTRTTITTTRTAMTATYGVSESCVDLNTPKNLEIYLKKLYFQFDSESHSTILNLISRSIFRLLNTWREESQWTTLFYI